MSTRTTKVGSLFGANLRRESDNDDSGNKRGGSRGPNHSRGRNPSSGRNSSSDHAWSAENEQDSEHSEHSQHSDASEAEIPTAKSSATKNKTIVEDKKQESTKERKKFLLHCINGYDSQVEQEIRRMEADEIFEGLIVALLAHSLSVVGLLLKHGKPYLGDGKALLDKLSTAKIDQEAKQTLLEQLVEHGYKFY
ncbi:hypothetical protein DM02DRAFT_734215 [Periconia macrospinosa]|uniref:Uncharacterized protein n=1 Tax=Periconia macrospinosa TaxID=97972 RepID=A0A2V1D140_9PLEO|nr:hypothetical protein DM02DRAFT_734215 [Periconia macrospinosa]